MAVLQFTIKYDTIGADAGPFDIKDCNGQLITTATRSELLAGKVVSLDETCATVDVISSGTCVVTDTLTMEFTPCNDTWVGVAPYCVTDNFCASGKLMLVNGVYKCVTETEQAATLQFDNICFAKTSSTEYGHLARIYKYGWTEADVDNGLYNPASANTEYTLAWTDSIAGWQINQYWSAVNLNNGQVSTSLGIFAREGIWLDTDCNGISNPLSGGAEMIVPYCYNNTGAERKIYIGILGDNKYKLTVNGNIVESEYDDSDFPNFRVFHIFPVTLVAGQNYFNFSFIGDGSVSDAGAFAIYDNTSAELAAATSDADLNILFKSSELTTGQRDLYSCPAGWNFDCITNTCKLNSYVDPTIKNTGYVAYTQRYNECQSITEDNTITGGVGTYVAPIQDLTTCPI